MRKFHDVEIYAGSRLATTGSRLEIVGLLLETGAAGPLLLKEIFSGQDDCTRCKEPTVLIFPEEDQMTLKEAFRSLSFNSGSPLSIIKNPGDVRSFMERLWAGQRTAGVADPRQSKPNTGVSVVEDPGQSHPITRVSTVGDENIPTINELRPDNLSVVDQSMDLDSDSDFEISPGIPPMVSESGEVEDSRIPKVSSTREDFVKKYKKNNNYVANPHPSGTSSNKNMKIKLRKSGPKYGRKLRYKCHLCVRKSFIDRNGLYSHYSHNHYKNQIIKLMDGAKRVCPYCGLQFKYLASSVGHVGSVHDKVEDFLPKHLHIKRNFPKELQNIQINVVTTEENDPKGEDLRSEQEDALEEQRNYNGNTEESTVEAERVEDKDAAGNDEDKASENVEDEDASEKVEDENSSRTVRDEDTAEAGEVEDGESAEHVAEGVGVDVTPQTLSKIRSLLFESDSDSDDD